MLTYNDYLAKMAVTRPETFLRLHEEEIFLIRIYPKALIALVRADNCSKKMKTVIENLLETIGFTMMT